MVRRTLPLWLVNAYALSGLEWHVSVGRLQQRNEEPTRFDILCSACGGAVAIAEHIHPDDVEDIQWDIHEYISNAEYLRRERVCKCGIETLEASAEPGGTQPLGTS